MSSPSLSPAPELPDAKSQDVKDNSAKRPASPESHASDSESESRSPKRRKSDSAEVGEAKSSPEPDTETAQPEAGPSTSPELPAVTNAHVQGDWQAIWSPQHNAYYFFNTRTNETTWTNPLASSDTPGSSTGDTITSSRAAIEAAALAAGIDPELAFLDPSLVAGPSTPAAFTYTAKFNARTGAFAKPDARNPEHVSEYERMKRMSSFYFDMDKWQEDVEKRNEEEADGGKKKKKPSKKDLVSREANAAQRRITDFCVQEMFKERKKQKKLAKTAWLRT